MSCLFAIWHAYLHAPASPDGAGAITNSFSQVETGSSCDMRWSRDQPSTPTATCARTLPEKQAICSSKKKDYTIVLSRDSYQSGYPQKRFHEVVCGYKFISTTWHQILQSVMYFYIE